MPGRRFLAGIPTAPREIRHPLPPYLLQIDRPAANVGVRDYVRLQRAVAKGTRDRQAALSARGGESMGVTHGSACMIATLPCKSEPPTKAMACTPPTLPTPTCTRPHRIQPPAAVTLAISAGQI